MLCSMSEGFPWGTAFDLNSRPSLGKNESLLGAKKATGLHLWVLESRVKVGRRASPLV